MAAQQICSVTDTRQKSIKRIIYTWVSSLTHSTRLFPNSVKLFHKYLKIFVAFSEGGFRPNNNRNPTEKQSLDLSPALCQHRGETGAKPTWHFTVSCCWQHLIHLQVSAIPLDQSEKSTLRCLSGGKPSTPGASQMREKGPGSSQMPSRSKRHLLGWEKEATQSCRGKKMETLKGI